MAREPGHAPDARRARGARIARADAAAPGTRARPFHHGWRDRAAARAGPRALGHQRDRERGAPGREGGANAPAGPVSAPGRDRRVPCDRADLGRDRLARDPRAVPDAARDRSIARRLVEPRDRASPRRGPRGGAARGRRARRGARPVPPLPRDARGAPPRARAERGRARRGPARARAHREPRRTGAADLASRLITSAPCPRHTARSNAPRSRTRWATSSSPSPNVSSRRPISLGSGNGSGGVTPIYT